MNGVLCLVLACLSGSLYDGFFERGNTAYGDGRLDDAIQAYGHLAASGIRSAPVYSNLAAAHFHGGDPGRAVLNYERALALEPGFGPALRGLDALSAALPRPPDLPPDFRSPWRRHDSGLRALPPALLLVFWWLLWGILLAAVWRPRPRTRRTAAAIAVAAGGAALMAGLMAGLARLPEPGVVVAGESALRYGPDGRDAVRAQLRAGDRVCVERTDGPWALVAAGDGQRGWMLRADLAAVSPPFQK